MSLCPEDRLVASRLLFTELHCVAQRRTAIQVDAVNAVLAGVDAITKRGAPRETSWKSLKSAAATPGDTRASHASLRPARPQ